MNTKICRMCGKELPIDDFHRNARSKDGLQFYCKQCHKQKIEESRLSRLSKTKQDGGGKLNKVYSNPALACFTPRQLMDELAARGYHATGKLTKNFQF